MYKFFLYIERVSNLYKVCTHTLFNGLTLRSFYLLVVCNGTLMAVIGGVFNSTRIGQ